MRPFTHPLYSSGVCALAVVLLTLVSSGPARAITTANNPNLHLSNPGSVFDGVAALVASGGDSCSGALLSSGQHVLTAAHCVTDAGGILNVSSLTAYFEGSQGTWTSESAAYSV